MTSAPRIRVVGAGVAGLTAALTFAEAGARVEIVERREAPGLGCSHLAGGMIAPYDFSGVRITLPNQGFSGEKTITVNGIDLVLMEVGPAHTPGDAMVFVVSEKVLYAGDIVFTGSTPVNWAGSSTSTRIESTSGRSGARRTSGGASLPTTSP